MKKYLSWFLITAGVLLILIAVYQKVSTIYNQNKLLKEYDAYVSMLKNMETSEFNAESENIQNENPVGDGTNTDIENNNIQEPGEDETGIENSGEQPAPEEKPVNKTPDYDELLKGKNISGLIEIPKIKVKSAILEGTDDSALKYAVGHYPKLGKPGEGNYVLLGHRNYVYGHFFRNIDRLETEDEVKITVGDTTYTYVVYESFVVKPEEVWVLEKTEEPIVTMITCTPIGTYTDRLIVRAKLLTE